MAKMSFVERANYVVAAINQEPHIYSMSWKQRYRVIEPVPGVRLIVLEHENQEIQEVSPDKLTNDIVAWLRLMGNPKWLVTGKQAATICDMWRACANPIPESQIRSVRPLNEPGHTWRRLPWDLRQGEKPTWDLLLSRCSNARAFKAWIGSLFFDDSDLQQYIWCFGTGNNGKGSINRFLGSILGRAYASKQPPAGNRHWTYGLIGKRLVVFPDCNDVSFVTQGLFKSLTGADPVDVEPKFRPAFTAIMNAKYLFFSNERPNLSSEAADTRRVIYCEFQSRDGEKNDPQFEVRLWQEGAEFLHSCLETYKEMCPTNTPLVSDKSDIVDWVETVEAEFLEALDFHFEILPKDTPGIEWIRPVVFQRHLQMAFPQRRKQLEFVAWLERRYGIKKVTAHTLLGEPKVYIGLVPKVQCQLVDIRTGKFTSGQPLTPGRQPV